MSRINTNVTALISARILNQNNVALSKTLERLSTGYRINRGSDDPAGPETPRNTNVAGDISSNHGHSVTITRAQIDAGGTIFVSVSGGGHLHDMEIAPAGVANHVVADV